MAGRIQYDDLIGVCGEVVSGFRDLLPEVKEYRKRFPGLFTTLFGPMHGIHHWARVGIYGLGIARALREQGRAADCLAPKGALERAVIYAAFFHDCARLTEDAERPHGRNGDKVWRHYAGEKGMSDDLRLAVSQALLFHVGHRPVNPEANEATICLCNANRLDRVRLGQKPDPEKMYDDGVWRELAPFSERLLTEVSLEKVKKDLGL